MIGVALLVMLLSACSKITMANYHKLSSGMTRSEVVAILGEPTESSAGSLLGLEGEVAKWEEGKLRINATFVNQKLAMHSLERPELASRE